jgi:hypothetical protein
MSSVSSIDPLQIIQRSVREAFYFFFALISGLVFLLLPVCIIFLPVREYFISQEWYIHILC